MENLKKDDAFLDAQIEQAVDKIVSSRISNEDDKLDVIQNIYLKTLVGLKKYTDQGKFICWMSVIARNEVTSFLRTKKKENDHECKLAGSLEQLQDSSEGLDKYLVMLEAYDDTINKLKTQKSPEINHRILESFFLNLLSKRCIAKQEGISAPKVARIISSYARSIYDKYSNMCAELEDNGVVLE